MGSWGSPERSPGCGKPGQMSRGGRREFGPSGRMGPGISPSACRRNSRGCRLRYPGNQDHRWPYAKDSGIGTGGIRDWGLPGCHGSRKTEGS